MSVITTELYEGIKKENVCLFHAKVCQSQSATMVAALLLSYSVEIFPAGRSQILELSILAVIILSAPAALLKRVSADPSGSLTQACMWALLEKIGLLPSYSICLKTTLINGFHWKVGLSARHHRFLCLSGLTVLLCCPRVQRVSDPLQDQRFERQHYSS